MITKEKLKIFSYYKGDVDSFAYGRRSHKKIITDTEFYLINSLLADIHLINNNLASKEYAESINLKIKENCDADTTIEELKQLRL